MKKTILLLVAILFGGAKLMAEGLVATLQQGETMTAFYGVNAFVDAYNAAEDGAVITLSEGKFNYIENIEKSITLIGNMAFDVEGYEKTYLGTAKIKANSVKLEGIYFSGTLYLGNVSDCHIKRCRVEELSSVNNTIHTNTLVDQCVVNLVYAMETSKNFGIKNSTIFSFYGLNSDTNIAYITNCFIWQYYYISYYSNPTRQPYAVYKNNVLGLYIDTYVKDSTVQLDFWSPSEYYNNYFYSTAGSSYTNLICAGFYADCINRGNKNSTSYTRRGDVSTNSFITDSFGMLGDDGTPVGITGGSGFSPYPSIPRVTSKQIDSRTDSQGKLNVKITVSTEETLVKEKTDTPETGETTEETTTR